MVESPGVALVCDMRGATTPELSLIDALARLQLVARRSGRSITVRDACEVGRELMGLAGLVDVLPVDDGPGRPED
ncbi:MAG: hypothetical protein ACRDZ0_13760 [Acidimicrobiales bacterium]